MFSPCIEGGIFNPNLVRTDGAISMSAGVPALIGLLLKITPGTSETSAQWSALHAESLSSSISLVISPRQVAQEAR